MSKKENKSNTKKIRGRVFEIVQYEKHPITGAELLNEETILLALRDRKSIKQYAYVCHDKDVYTEKELAEKIKGKGTYEVSSKKPRHWHIVISCPNAVDLEAVAKWFGVEPQFVMLPKGRGAFLDCVQYLTHEKVPEKAQYTDDNIRANFDFRNELEQREKRILEYGRDLDKKSEMRYKVLYEGYSLKQCMNEDKLLVMSVTVHILKSWNGSKLSILLAKH